MEECDLDLNKWIYCGIPYTGTEEIRLYIREHILDTRTHSI